MVKSHSEVYILIWRCGGLLGSMYLVMYIKLSNVKYAVQGVYMVTSRSARNKYIRPILHGYRYSWESHIQCLHAICTHEVETDPNHGISQRIAWSDRVCVWYTLNRQTCAITLNALMNSWNKSSFFGRLPIVCQYPRLGESSLPINLQHRWCCFS